MSNENRKKTIAVLTESKIQLSITIGAVVMVIANMWLFNKLSPLARDIAIISEKVEAQEEVDKNFVPRTEIEARLDAIIIQLNRIENKL